MKVLVTPKTEMKATKATTLSMKKVLRLLPWLRKRTKLARPLERINKILPLQNSVTKPPPKQWVRGKLQERQHALSHSPPGSPGRVNPLGSPREDPEDEVMQVDAQRNNLTIPLDLAEQIDAIQEEEVGPESLLFQKMHSRYLRGDLNTTDDVRATFETLLGEDGAVFRRLHVRC
jgi:hypothetical protein